MVSTEQKKEQPTSDSRRSSRAINPNQKTPSRSWMGYRRTRATPTRRICYQKGSGENYNRNNTEYHRTGITDAPRDT